MDAAIWGLVVIAVVVAGAFFFFTRESVVLPLEELLSRLSHIQNDPQLTAAQKLHLAEIAYHGFESNVVSVVGGVHDVFTPGSIVIKTTSKLLPLIGVELSRVSPEQLRGFDKNKPVTLRVRLPAWNRYSDVVGLPAGFRDARVFYGGHWYNVKSTYRVRDPSEPRTGEFPKQPPAQKTGQFAALPKVTVRTGEFKAFSNTGQKTTEVKIVRPDDPKRSQ